MRRVAVVGASLAGHQAAHTLRARGFDGTVTVVGSERHRPYDRYPLSKGFLTGETERGRLDLDADVPGVTWRLGETVTGVDLARGRVILDHGEGLPFDGLVVASGASPRDRGTVAAGGGAFVLRTVDDAADLRVALDGPGRRVVVAGAGLIGSEIAAAVVRAGHHTTLVDPGDVPTRRTLGHLVARHLLELHRAAGVHLRTRTRVRGLAREDGHVRGVVLDDGTTLGADVVVMATGTRPNVDWLRDTGLGVVGGVDCRPTLHAVGSDRVVAAGDVARVPHPLLGGESVRVEHWASTRAQAALAAENLLAGPAASRPLTALPEFGTTIHGARIRAVGFPQLADSGRVVWGSLEAGAAVVALSRGGSAVAAVSVNATAELSRWAPRT